MKNLEELLFYREIRNVPARWHRMIDLAALSWSVVIFAIYANVFLVVGGPGLEKLRANMAYLESESKFAMHAYLALFAMVLITRSGFGYYSYAGFERATGEKINHAYVLFCMLANSTINIVMLATLGLIGLVLVALDIPFSAFMNSVFTFAETFVAGVPVIVQLPYWVALPLSLLLLTFFEYWWHRLAHMSRALWLLAHRQHHISETLHGASTFEADPMFALGLAWRSFAVGMIGGAVTKMLCGQDLFIELAIFHMFGLLFDIHNHIAATYETIRSRPWLFRIFQFFGHGPHHYLHHSSLAEHTIANLGGHLPFFLWDRIFGTHHMPPEKRPPIGLTNRPAYYWSPTAFALSGPAQILYELKHNKSLRERFLIIFGGIYYLPPETKSFFLKDETSYYNGTVSVEAEAG